jgi:hypothetical protein
MDFPLNLLSPLYGRTTTSIEYKADMDRDGKDGGKAVK